MNCEKSELNNSESDISLIDTSTQTSSASVKLSSKLPLPRDIATLDNDSVNVLKFCHIIQDRKDAKTVHTEKNTVRNFSAAQGTSDITSDDKNTAKRYKYCQEVIKPQLESRLDCFDFDEVILKTLDSVSKSFTASDLSFESNTDRKHKTCFEESSKSNFAKVEVNSSFINMDENKLNQCPKSKSDEPSRCPTPPEQTGSPRAQTPSKEDLCGAITHKPESQCGNKVKCTPRLKKVCSKHGASKCDKESDENALSDCNEVIITTDDEILVARPDQEPQLYETDDEDIEGISQLNENVSVPKSFAETHNETMAIIKVAMEDFIGKIYTTTQDAVTLIASESAKQLVKAKISEAVNTNIHKREDPETGLKTDIEKSEKVTNELPASRAEVIKNILTKVDSAFTVLGEHISKSFENFPKAANYNDKSSPYDKPETPTDVTHLFTPEPEPTSNSVFSAIKSKIMSIFCEPEPKLLERPLSVQSSVSISANEQEEDENFIEKFIE